MSNTANSSTAQDVVRAPLLWISASAGTGKTYRLSTRYLELLFSGVPLDSIVATTFTRKAAGEIFDRVLLRLAEAARDDRAREALAEAIGRAELTRRRCHEVLSNFLHQLHRLRIGTIDSLFAQIARCYALELHLPLGWTIREEHELAALRQNAIRSVMDDHQTQKLQTIVNMMAKGDSLRSIARIMDQAVLDGYTAFRDSDATAWEYPRLPRVPRATAAELLESLRCLGDKFPDFEKAIEKDIDRWGTVPWDKLLGVGIYKKVLEGAATFNRKELPDELVECYRDLNAHAANELVKLVIWQTQGMYKLLEAYDTQVKNLRGGGLSFDDVTWYVARHVHARQVAQEDATETPAADFAFRMDGRMLHWLLDEFQDTSALQWRVLKSLVLGAPASESSSFFCVGDAKQAIYGWRGGSARIFRSIPTDPAWPKMEQDQLVQSWRSAPAVIETVNQVFQQGHRHNRLEKYPAVPRWLSEFPTHSTVRRDWPGYAVLQVANDKEAIFEAAVAEIKRLTAEAPGRSIGVLVRKNQAVALLRHKLIEEGVAASEEGGNPLTDSPAVAWVRAWLQLLDHPHDSVARFQILNCPLADILLDEKGPASDRRLDDADQLKDDAAFAELARRGKSELVESGFGATIEALVKQLAAHVGARDARRLEQLVELAYRYEPGAGLRTGPFLRLLEAKRVADPGDQPVRVMTIHQAKGLEFDCVVLPELEVNWYQSQASLVTHRPSPAAPIDRIFRRPNQTVQQMLLKQEQEDCAEANSEYVTELLCLLYVALTRPRFGLYMFVAPQTKPDHSYDWAGLLRASLAGGEPLQPGTIAFETGDWDWWKHAPRDGDETIASEKRPPKQLRLVPRVGDGRKLPQRTAPSQAAHGGRLRAADLLAEPNSAMEFGTAVHLWFESISWMDESGGDPDHRELLAAASRRMSGVTGEQLQQWYARFTSFLAREEVVRFLSRGSYSVAEPFGMRPAGGAKVVDWQVVHERPIHWPTDDGSLIVGSIDRLVLGRDDSGRVRAAHIIDFKTDQIDDERKLKQRADHYRPQVEAYARVIAELYQLPESAVVADLLFVAS